MKRFLIKEDCVRTSLKRVVLACSVKEALEFYADSMRCSRDYTIDGNRVFINGLVFKCQEILSR